MRGYYKGSMFKLELSRCATGHLVYITINHTANMASLGITNDQGIFAPPTINNNFLLLSSSRKRNNKGYEVQVLRSHTNSSEMTAKVCYIVSLT